MSLNAINKVVQDNAGNIMAGAQVEFRQESDNALVAVYSDSQGINQVGNPYTTADGVITLWTESNKVKITATLGAKTIVQRGVFVGVKAEFIDDFVERIIAEGIAGLYVGMYVNTAAGIAATIDGEYFGVPSLDDDEYVILYVNNSGVADYVSTSPSATLLLRLTAEAQANIGAEAGAEAARDLAELYRDQAASQVAASSAQADRSETAATNSEYWAGLAASTTPNAAIRINPRTIAESVGIANSHNGLSAGPIAIGDNVIVTVGTNATWSIV